MGGSIAKNGCLIAAPLPRWLEALTLRVSQALDLDEPANHVLINEYKPGDGILPHEDGPTYRPTVAILSLRAPSIIRFYSKRYGEEGDFM